jgi:hypothetical protein
MQHAVSGKSNPRRLSPGGPRLEYVFDIDQRRAVPNPPRKHSLAKVVIDRSVIGKINVTVTLEIRVQYHIHQTLKPAGPNRGYASYGFRVQDTVTNDAQIATALGHEHCAIGQKSNRPGLTKTTRDNDDLKLSMLRHCAFDQKRTFAEVRCRPLDPRRHRRRRRRQRVGIERRQTGRLCQHMS